jgi:hypothetical protein
MLKSFEYAAGDVKLPFDYEAALSDAPQPHNLTWDKEDFVPDNPQAFVNIDGELWQYRMNFFTYESKVTRYKGPDIDHMEFVDDIETGFNFTWFMSGFWYDESEKKLYAPVHMERRPFTDYACWGPRRIGLATSLDKGATWTYDGDIITSESYHYEDDMNKFSGSYYFNGCSDFHFYVDDRNEYMYLYWTGAWFLKGDNFSFSAIRGSWETHVSRCALKDKMSPGKWVNYYNGKWTENALGGKSSIVIPNQGLNSIIYSTALNKYIIAGYCWWSGSASEKYGFCISACEDLSKQDWTPFGIFPEMDKGAFSSFFNIEGTDTRVCNDRFRFYAYHHSDLGPYMINQFKRLDITLKEGARAATGFNTPQYSFEPHPESSDETVNRKTKIIGASYPEVQYFGEWTEITENKYVYFEGKAKAGSNEGDSIEFKFNGSDIYWRAIRMPDAGMVDVYIDGKYANSVDLYFPKRIFTQFAYIKKGLDPNADHTIKLVIKNEKNRNSTGNLVRHIAFEYSAESYRASFEFCGAWWGKNNWYYEQWLNNEKKPLTFHHSDDSFYHTDYWHGDYDCRIGLDYMLPSHVSVVRKWVAPHSGKIQIEGQANSVFDNGNGTFIRILKNEEELLANTFVIFNSPNNHDIVTEVKKGDSICFVASKHVSNEIIIWDPTVTYIESVDDSGNEPVVFGSDINIAFHRKASARTANADNYRPGDGSPASAVDGKDETRYFCTYTGDNWLTLDLEQLCKINRWVVKHNGVVEKLPPVTTYNSVYTYNTRKFKLQRSDDGINWIDVDEVLDNRFAVTDRIVEEFSTRYIRLYIYLGNNIQYDPGVRIHEFELYYVKDK